MKRSAALALGVCCLLLAGLAVGTGRVRAGEKDKDDERVEKRIEKTIRVVRSGGGFLGVHLEDVDGGRGAQVRAVEPNSAAEKAGLEDGDVIVRFDGVDVRSARQLARVVRETPAGRAVAIEVKRGDDTRTLTATLGEGRHGLHVGPGELIVPEIEDLDIEPELAPGVGPHVFRWHGDDGNDFTMGWSPFRPRLGIRFIEMGEQLADYFGLATDQGVLVTSVEAGTPAAKAGIRAGDVVVEFDGKSIRDGAELRREVARAEGGRAVTMKLQRDGSARDVEVTLPAPERPKKMERHEPGVSL
jgi:S1-C subfamily serine protease